MRNSKKLVYNDNAECYDLLSKILEDKEYYSNHTKQYTENNNKNTVSFLENYEFTIGSDETGKGEWYGPLVITAVCTSHEENLKLKEIGVKDSKKLSRKNILDLYCEIEKLNIKQESIVLTPFSYNKLYAKFKSEGKNLNHLLAYLHSKVITNLLSQINTTNVLVIIDKFDYKKMNEYLDVNKNIKIIQETNGERFIPVATSSIIAKYHYEKRLKDIEKRYNIVSKLIEEFILTEDLRRNLYEVYDLERLSGRIAMGNANARDLIQLKNSLKVLPIIKEMLKTIHFYQDIDDVDALYELLSTSIYEEPPISLKEGYLIKEEYSKELDELKALRSGGKEFISNYEQEEREKTGIKNLKVGFNKVFGYYIEISKGNLPLVKEEFGYIRKQTLTNCERFINPILKEKEDLVLSAEEKIINLIYTKFLGSSLTEEEQILVKKVDDDSFPKTIKGKKEIPFWIWNTNNPYIASGGIVSNITDMIKYIDLTINSNTDFSINKTRIYVIIRYQFKRIKGTLNIKIQKEKMFIENNNYYYKYINDSDKKLNLYANSDIQVNDKIIYKKGELIHEMKTDNNGKVLVNDLYIGSYCLKDDTEYEKCFEVLTDEEIKITIKKPLDKGGLIIHNISNNTENIKDTIIELYNKDNLLIHTGSTNDEGIIKITDLKTDKYCIKQKKINDIYEK